VRISGKKEKRAAWASGGAGETGREWSGKAGGRCKKEKTGRKGNASWEILGGVQKKRRLI